MSQRRFDFGLKGRGWWAPVLLLLGLGALYLFRLGSAGLYDDDESVYAEVAREMLALKTWFTPHLNFIPYLEKPPLFYWLVTLAFKTFGFSEFSARLPTALAAVAGIGCVYGIGRDLWGRRAGLASGAVLGTSFGYFIFGRMVLPDMVFVVLLTAAFWGFARTLMDESAPRAAVFGGYAAMGGAVLAKGMIGLLFPALAVGAFLLLTRDRQALRRLKVVRGGALFLLIAAPWHVLMAREYPGFLWYYLVTKHVFRFLGHPELLNTAALPVSIYLLMTLVWFCPWSLFLPAALHRCWSRGLERRRADRGSLLVLLWAGVVIGFFALSASHLEYYALPALPALALCVGRLWNDEVDLARKPIRSKGLMAAWGGLIVFALCLVPAAHFFPGLAHTRFYNLFPHVALPADSLRSAAFAPVKIYNVPSFARLVPVLETGAGLLIAGVAASAWAWFRRRPKLALTCLAGAAGLSLAVLAHGFLLYEPYRSVVQLAGVLRSELQPGEQVVLEGRYENHAGMAFYTGQRVRVYRGGYGILIYGSRFADAGETFITDEKFARLWKGPQRVYLLSDAPDCLPRLLACAAGTVVLGRTGNNWLLTNHAGTLVFRNHVPSGGPPPAGPALAGTDRTFKSYRQAP